MFGLIKILSYLTIVMLVAGYAFASSVRRDRLTRLDRRLPLLMLALLVALYLVPNFWYLYALLLVLPTALSRTRIDACVVYLVALVGVTTVQQDLTIGGLYVTPLNTGYILALGLLVATAFRPVDGRPLAGRRFDLPVLILVTLSILSQVRGQNLTSVLRVLQFEVVWMAVPYYVMSRSIRSPGDMQRLLMAMVVGGFMLSAVSVYEALRSWPIYLTMDIRLAMANDNISQSLRVRAGLMRSATSFGESTSFSIFLAMSLIATMAMKSAFRSKLRYLAVVGVIAVGLLLAQARGGWVAAVISILAYDLYLRNYARVAGRVAIIGVGVLMLLFASAGSPRLAEALGVSGDALGTKDYRVDLMRRGIDEIRKHPLAGTTMAEVSFNMRDMLQGEHIIDFVNGYIMYGVTTGVPGVIALFVVFASLSLWMVARRGRPRPGEPPDRIGAFVFAVATSFIVSAATTGFLGRSVSLFMVVVAIGSVHHMTRRRAAGSAGPRWSPAPGAAAIGEPQPA